MEDVPMERVFGKEVGQVMVKEHNANGVKLHMNAGVKEITKNNYGNVNGVVLNDGTVLDVNMVIVGVGVHPNTSFLKRTENGIKRDRQQALVCDPFLQTSEKDIFAAGDVASFPFWLTG